MIEKKVDKFLPNSIYSVAVDVPSKAKILVRSEGFEEVRSIHLSKYVDDMVKKDYVRIFKLEISSSNISSWENDEFSIDLEPYFGNSDLYVNHNSLPEDPNDLTKYKWSST